MELSDDDELMEDAAGDDSVNVRGNDEECREKPPLEDELPVLNTEESSDRKARRVFWRLNAYFGESEQHAMEVDVASNQSAIQMVSPLEMFQKYVPGELLDVVATCTNQRLVELGKKSKHHSRGRHQVLGRMLLHVHLQVSVAEDVLEPKVPAPPGCRSIEQKQVLRHQGQPEGSG